MKNRTSDIASKESIRKIIIITSIILSAYHTYSQDKKIFVINPGQKITDVVLPADMYRYADFKTGTVYFKDRRESNALMNYNLVLNEIQFIDAKGDTFSLADEQLIKLITIDNDSFFYSKGCYELVNSFNNIRLVRREVIYKSSVNKIGAYDQPVQGGSASSYTSFSSGGRDINLIVNEKITMKKEESYYLAYQNGHIMPASKRNLQREFPKYSAAIEEYSNSNSIDFRKGKDMEKLFDYLKQYRMQ